MIENSLTHYEHLKITVSNFDDLLKANALFMLSN